MVNRRVFTDEEAKAFLARQDMKVEKRFQKNIKRKIAIKSIVFKPLAIICNLASMVLRGIGFLTSFGILFGLFEIWGIFSSIFNGSGFAGFSTLIGAVELIILPFIVYAFSVITENLYEYFSSNTYL